MLDSGFSLTPSLSRWERGHALRVPAMPPALDRAVDKCYRPAEFPSDRSRVEYRFQRYEQLTAPLAPTAKAQPQTRGQGCAGFRQWLASGE